MVKCVVVLKSICVHRCMSYHMKNNSSANNEFLSPDIANSSVVTVVLNISL